MLVCRFRWTRVPLGLVLLTLLLAPLSAQARTWVVRLDGSGDFTRIQEAVDVAQPGDTVLVGPGRYTWTNQGPGDNPPAPDKPHGMVVLWVDRPRGVTFVSEAGPEQTILDAEGQGRVIFANGDNDPVLLVEFTISGFTITGGVAPKAPNNEPLPRQGGGLAMHLVYPLIENCIFVNNEAEEGGAVWAGGVGSIEIRNCEFRDNLALAGAGILLINSHVLTQVVDCVFVGNHAQRVDGSGGVGGGVATLNDNYRIERCIFYDNVADLSGSGFYGVNGKPGVLRYNTFRENVNTPGAPTVRLRWSQLYTATSDFQLENNLVAFNSPGRAIEVDPLVDVTFGCNDFFGNSGGNWTSDVADWFGLLGNMNQDPLFCAFGGEIWTVERSSPTLAANNSCSDMIGMSLNGGRNCGGLGLDPPDDLVDTGGDPVVLRVHSAAPNPLTARGQGTVVAYDLPRDQTVDVAVFDLAGRLVATLHQGHQRAGRNEVRWTGQDQSGRRVAAGVYLVRLKTGQRVAVQRVVVVS